MNNRQIPKILGVITITFLLLVSFVTPARAMGIQAGDMLVISSDVPDDLYAAARHFTLSATIHGDLIVAAQTITIESNGTVEGDILAIAQDIVIMGEVKGDVRIAGGVLILSPTGKIDEDLVAAGYSLELEQGSQVGLPENTVGGNVLFAGSQASFAGSILRDAQVAGEGLELNGTVGGKVKVIVGRPKAERLPVYTIPGLSKAHTIASGLTFGSGARIGESLDYTSPVEADVPATVISSDKITFHQKNFYWDRVQPPRRVSALSSAASWLLNQFRWFLSLLLVGLLLAWVLPEFTLNSAENVRTKTVNSLGWGFVSIFALVFGLLSLIVSVGILALALGFLKLGGLVTLVIILGIMLLFALVIVYGITAVLISKVVVSYLGGQMILRRIKPAWAKSRIWPLVPGLLLFAILTALPFYVGQFINLVVILLGLGALWLAVSDWVRHKTSKSDELA